MLGFSEGEAGAMFHLVAAILKIGNLQFQHRSNLDGTDGCRLLNEEGSSEMLQFTITFNCLGSDSAFWGLYTVISVLWGLF